MGRTRHGWQNLASILLLLICSGLGQASAQTSGPAPDQPVFSDPEKAELVNKLDELLLQNQKLEDQARQLEDENRRLVSEIREIRQKLANQSAAGLGSLPAFAATQPAEATDSTSLSSSDVAVPPQPNQIPQGVATGALQMQGSSEEEKSWGTYTPNLGYKVASTENGDMSVSIYTYFRYLNQLNLSPSYTNAFGVTSSIQQRQDYQLNKVQIKFLGWIWNEKIRYFLYAWTANPNQGQGAQVVLAGNVNFNFSKLFQFGVGVASLPGTRSVEGNFPFWLSVDSRLIADEFFRPSYTQGFWARGDITDKLRYQAMVGTNTSILGVNAGQLTNHPTTFAGALVWTPLREYGQGFGDFEDHQKVAIRLGGHFTRSREDKQSQPNTEAFDNTQIRLSDGTIIFTPDIFGPNTTVNTVTYKMASFDGGIKYHGYALEGEYFLRWLDNFAGINTAGLPALFDHGFQLQPSAMVVPKTVQVYAGGSAIFGKFGTPWDTRIGVSYFPLKNKVVRFVNEGLYLRNSPVGYFAVPFTVGGNGWVFHSNVELAF